MRGLSPVVAHYRNAYLPRSETFIHEVVARHSRYEPVVLTHERQNPESFPAPGPLDVVRPILSGGLLSFLDRSAALTIRRRQFAVGRALRRRGPAILHAHFGEDGVVATRAARGTGIPVIVTFYGVDATRLAAHALWRRRFRRLFQRARFVLAEGPRLRRRLLALGCPAERARLQPIPVRFDLFPFRIRTRPEDGRVIVLQACRFVEKKGVDLTVEAFARIAGSWPEAELWLLGDGPERPRVEAVVDREGLRSRVRLLGMRSHEEYAELLERAHLFVQPSRTAANGDGEGGAPTTLLEAQASGLPVVASDHADIPSVVAEDGALLAREGDVAGVARALDHLLAHPEEWAPRGEAGRRWVEERHDPDRLASRLEDLYDEATGRTTPTASGPEGDARASGREGDARAAAPEPGRPARPLVSVVLPTRNRERRLKRALGSVFRQTLEDFELIVVDDASTDGTADLLRRTAARDARVRTLTIPDRVGAAVARNRAIEAARAPWVAFLDDDDEWLPRKLERQIAALRDGGADFAYSPFVYVEASGRERVLGVVDVGGKDPRSALLGGNFIGQSSVVVRRAPLLEVGGFDPALPRLQDWDLWVRLAGTLHFRFVPAPLVRIHHSPSGISASVEDLREAVRLLLAKAEADPDFGPSERAEWMYALGTALLMEGDRAGGRRLVFRSLCRRPLPHRAAMGALSLAGGRGFEAAVRTYERLAGLVRRRKLESVEAPGTEG